jgi:hypothetical protein
VIRRACVLFVLAASLAAPSGAQAKQQLTLVISNRVPEAGEAVRAVIRITPAQARCTMRLVAVAPKVVIATALKTLAVRRAPQLGFYVPLARKTPKEWRATVRFPRAGLWRLVVPNWCAAGYVLPPTIVQRVTVHPAGS